MRPHLDLTDAIRLVRSRIDSDGDYISGHETRTRQFLIDPVLTALGWTVLDPTSVLLEAKVHTGYADYLGVEKDSSVFVVEAKRLGTNIGREPTDQVSRYANWLGLEHAVVTDGNVWRFLEVSGMGASAVSVLIETRCDQGPVNRIVESLSRASLLLATPDNTLE